MTALINILQEQPPEPPRLRPRLLSPSQLLPVRVCVCACVRARARAYMGVVVITNILQAQPPQMQLPPVRARVHPCVGAPVRLCVRTPGHTCVCACVRPCARACVHAWSRHSCCFRSNDVQRHVHRHVHRHLHRHAYSHAMCIGIVYRHCV